MANKILILEHCFFGILKIGEFFWYRKEEYQKLKHYYGTRLSNNQEIGMSESEIVERKISEVKNEDLVTWQQAKVLKNATNLRIKEIELQTNHKDKRVFQTKFVTEENQVVDTFYWIKEEEDEK